MKAGCPAELVMGQVAYSQLAFPNPHAAVMVDHKDSIGAPPDVELDHVRAQGQGDGSLKGRQRILHCQVVGPAMGHYAGAPYPVCHATDSLPASSLSPGTSRSLSPVHLTEFSSKARNSGSGTATLLARCSALSPLLSQTARPRPCSFAVTSETPNTLG